MYSNPLVAVPVLFGLSMLAAIFLFRFFQATAVITTKEYQLGGSIAGFVVVYMILNSSYNTLSGEKKKLDYKDQQIAQMAQELKDLRAYSAAHDVEGVVNPYSDHTKVVLAVTETDLPINRQFRLQAPCLDPKTEKLVLYVLQEGKVYPYEIPREQQLSDLITIPIPPQR